MPGIINQLGPDSLASLKRLAESMQKQAAAKGGAAPIPEDDEVPDLVENFEEAAKEGKKIEELD